MKVVKVQFHKLDKEYFFLPEFTETPGLDIKIGDSVVVETSLGQDVGRITAWTEWESPKAIEKNNSEKNNTEFIQENISDVKAMLRPLQEEDLDILRVQKKEGVKKFLECKKLIDKYELKSMKLIDMAESYDNKRITFYFIADSRVDFRDLIKELVQKYHKKIRLQQVGVRDAVKVSGDIGSCGMPLCCKAWLSTIGSVTPDSIKNQELSHRGPDRLSGPCGRLKCCLRFEEEAYKYSRENMPKEGDFIKTAAGLAKVVAVHPIKQTVNLDIDGNIVEYPYLEGKLCEKNEECK
ncbi:MAG: regulatory iron-sulfur-containing complex subunit RicT [Patescibacteria group bacterium]|jgi:cell fate regulator YaaT (PSP1 superfamily)